MVKVLVNGGLFEISKVEEIVEKRVPFNGTNIRLVQIAKDGKQAVSGLHFQVKILSATSLPLVSSRLEICQQLRSRKS